jgi:hypothetical protein
VRIAFERLGDHLLASRLIEGIGGADIRAAFSGDGALAFAVSELEKIQEYAGLIEALSIQLPERYAIELPDCAKDSDIRREVTKRTVAVLPWRDPKYITQRTCDIFLQSLTIRGFAYTALDAALSVGTSPSAMDALWLHEMFISKPMPDRDAFWCGYLYKRYEELGPVEKLLRMAFAVEAAHVPPEITERWATALLWFCAATDQRVRDHATKALVQLTEQTPQLWQTLIERFIAVDDEYVVERCLAAAYGTLLRVRDKSVEGLIAGIVFKEIFKDSSWRRARQAWLGRAHREEVSVDCSRAFGSTSR